MVNKNKSQQPVVLLSSVKKVFLRDFRNLPENTFATSGLLFYLKRDPDKGVFL